ncbi:hypothetical protein CPB86DRAFT_265459 [Serendipita vermifera]|nr:hypothetical protein CPB86DRAFT_265459 [Serendipita vermifera]
MCPRRGKKISLRSHWSFFFFSALSRSCQGSNKLEPGIGAFLCRSLPAAFDAAFRRPSLSVLSLTVLVTIGDIQEENGGRFKSPSSC